MKVFLLRFGELFLKGGNKKIFEAALEKDIKKKLEGIPLEFKKTQGRYVISNFDDKYTLEIKEKRKYSKYTLRVFTEQYWPLF